MPVIKWKSFTDAESEREYHVMGSRLPLKAYWTIPKFLRLTLAIQRQLSQSDGLIGYTLLAQLPSKTFWTLSVWEDAQRLADFAKKVPHSDIMVELRPQMAETKFLTWKLAGSAVPPSWDEAIERLSAG